MVAEPMEGFYSGHSNLQSRLESSGSYGSIQRNRDGVPIWDGDPALLEEFTEACLRYEQTVVKEKRYLCGPRVASELRGPAKRVLIGRPADWLSYDGGIRRLIDALRLERGQPKVPEMSELLMRYFKGTRRSKGESMNDYVTRKAEAYTRAQQSMARYQKDHSQSRSTWTPTRTAWSGSQGVGSDQATETWHDVQEEDEAEEADSAGGTNSDADPWAQWADWEAWRNRRWWQEATWWNYGSSAGQWSQAPDSTEWSTRDLPEILPDYIQGWYLFVDSGLDVMERNVLQAELRGDFSVRAVEEVLRKHWSDHDLRKRDAEKGRMFTANSVEETEDEELISCLGEWDPDSLEAEGYSVDDIEVMAAEREKAHEACMMLREARQTLKDARAKQHAVKMARQYYAVKPREPFNRGNAASLGPVKCFRCGGPHKIAVCPEKPRAAVQQSKVATIEEEAPFVFLAEAKSFEAYAMSTQSAGEPMMTTAEVVEAGKAVVDGGATRTIGSAYALSRIMEINEGKYGRDGLLKLDMTDRPSFGFGNSSKDRCASTAHMAVPLAGKMPSMKVHALDKGNSPVLLSVHSLRQLGAVVDFENDMAIFRHVDPAKVVSFERSAAGHQIMPLTEDIFQNAVCLDRPVQSLKDLCC